MASNNSYKSFNDSNNHNKINGYSNPYDNNYYDNRPLIQDDDDDFEEYDDYDEKEPSYQDGYEEEPNYGSESIETDGEDQGGTGLENENQGENSNEPQTLKEKYDAAKQKFEDTKEKARQTAENIKNAPQNIKNKANEVATNVKNAPQNVKNRLNQAKTNIQNAPQNIKNGIKNAPQKAKEGAINQVKKAKESANKKIKAKKEAGKKKIKKIKASIKVLGAVGGFLLGFAALMIPVILMAALYEALFGLTGGKENAGHTGVNMKYTKEEIEQSLLYVGDSRMVGMKTTLNNSNIHFIAQESMGYNWLVGQKENIENTIKDNKISFVVFNLGVNDLSSIDSYLNFYNTYLNSSDDGVYYFFLSVNPIDDTKAKSYGYQVENANIIPFNNKLQAAVGDKYINSYSEIKDNLYTEDGIHYKDSTNQLIHSIVINYIMNNVTKMGNYSLLDEYPNGIENTKLLTIPITEALGEDGFKSLEESISAAINKAGKCTKQAAAAAGVTLAYNLYQRGYRIPYYWGGEHSGNYVILNPDYGKKYGTSCSPTTCYNIFGFDCSGFTSWAYSIVANAPVAGGTSTFLNLGEKISFENAETGDYLVNDGHIIMIIENKGSYLVTLESTGTYNGVNNGLIFSTKTPAQISASHYRIKTIQSYLDKVCSW